MQLGNQGTAFLPDGGALPGGAYPVYLNLQVAEDGSATGHVHFLGEPKYPRPISIGIEFDLHVPHPDSIFGDDVVFKVRFVDDSGAITGYQYGSPAQFGPHLGKGLLNVENIAMNARDVFVIHGRDERLRAGIFDFLSSLDLHPMEWEYAVQLTQKSTPYVGEVLDAAFSHAQAVVVLFTPDDVAKLRWDLRAKNEPQHEMVLTPQARPNVLFESGMAMARHPDRTILVEIGTLRPFSDVGGRHMIRMDNSVEKRKALALRLQSAGCAVNLSGDWEKRGDLTAPAAYTEEKPPPDSSVAAGSVSGPNSVNPPAYLLPDLISELEDNLAAARAPTAGDVYVRPSNKIWKENRNRFSIPEPAFAGIVDAYRRIDRWLDIVLSGLHPAIGSPALNAMTDSLKHELPGLITELKKLDMGAHKAIAQAARDASRPDAEKDRTRARLLEHKGKPVMQQRESYRDRFEPSAVILIDVNEDSVILRANGSGNFDPYHWPLNKVTVETDARGRFTVVLDDSKMQRR